jgi:5-methylcytosine-specific restriction enzyme subunit McrC
MTEVQVFEHSDWFSVSNRKELQTYLEQVWRSKLVLSDYESHKHEETVIKQPFLNFDGDLVKCKNYVGFIQSEDLFLVIHPKVFKSLPLDPESNELILRHLFYWFDYCRRWKFPFSNVNTGHLENVDLPELFIKLIADQFYKAIDEQPLSLYTEVQDSLLIPKGRINFNRYINEHFNRGNQQILSCDHELLLFDNPFNQTIKYVTRFLKTKAKFNKTQQKLDEVIFLLDEVSDRECTIELLNSAKINPFFSDYEKVRELCQMVLNQQTYNQNQAAQSHWSLLFPMEYIFEDFIAGFIDQHFSDVWKVEYQKSDMYLTTERVFQMQHDIFLTSIASPEKRIIVDTKYKLRGKFKDENKRGIAQSDLYQMTSYAYRRGCENVLLIYPNEDDMIKESDTFNISGFNELYNIKVIAAEVPFWSSSGFKEIELPLIQNLKSLLNKF